MLSSLKIRTRMLVLGSVFICSSIAVGVIGIIDIRTINNDFNNIVSIEQNVNDLAAEVRDLLGDLKSNAPAEEIESAYTELTRLSEQLKIESTNSYNQFEELFRSSFQTIGIIVIAVSVIILVMIVLIANSITKPIHIMKSKLFQMSNGELTLEVPAGYKGEFEEIFKRLKDMLEKFHTLLNSVKEIGNEAVQESEVVVEGFDSVGDMVQEIYSRLGSAENSAKDQVALLQNDTEAVEGVVNGIQQIAVSSQAVAELAIETVTQANDGSAVIEKSMTQMETINQRVENTSDVVDSLVMRTKTIDAALNAITAIAEQTNLLALNASIEAARAGEQGRGFAVVADEVAKLASQSKESANEINILLKEINEDTKEALKAMEQGKTESRQGIEVIQQAGQAFNSIVKQISTMTDQVQEVSATVEEISTGSAEVSASLANNVETAKEISKDIVFAAKRYNEMEILYAETTVPQFREVYEINKGLNKDLETFKTEKVEK